MKDERGGYLARPQPSSLADVVEVILDKGLVIDAYVRVSLVGIELLTVDARIVVSSVDTYLRFAEATNRLDLSGKGGETLVELGGTVVENVASNVVEHKVDDAFDTVGDVFGESVEKVARGAGRKLVEVGEDVRDWVSDEDEDEDQQQS